MKVSIVIPAYNEEAALPLLRARLTATIAALGAYEFEVLIVDDHSGDATPRLIAEWARADARVRGIRLARNCGSHAALAAGLAHCTGDGAVLMAADLQDPPELLARLLRGWQEGHAVVWAARAARAGETWRTRLLSRVYWGLMRGLTGAETPALGADVALLDRRVIDALRTVTEKNTSLLGLVTWLGFRQTRIEYIKAPRAAGRSGWTGSKKLKLAIDSVVSFTALPIRLTWLCGLAFLGGWTVWTIGVGLSWVLHLGRVSVATATVIGLLLLGFGLLLTFLGAAGEYLWRAYDEARGRPRYVVEELIGFDNSRFVAEAQGTPTVAGRMPERLEVGSGA